MTLLRTRGLRAFYGDFQALYDIDVTVEEGENGRPIGALTAHEIVRQGVAMVPEGRKLFPSLSVEENLLLGAYCGRTGPWSLARVYELFPMLAQRRAAPRRRPRCRAASSRWRRSAVRSCQIRGYCYATSCRSDWRRWSSATSMCVLARSPPPGWR
jgi:ABC-type branched-subunit amino acid transport system ATPase component